MMVGTEPRGDGSKATQLILRSLTSCFSVYKLRKRTTTDVQGSVLSRQGHLVAAAAFADTRRFDLRYTCQRPIPAGKIALVAALRNGRREKGGRGEVKSLSTSADGDECGHGACSQECTL